ncbi:MAG TPA: hypothetical protein DCF63_06405 [Planctomycetaceae bacterium]|nr:hypothetical protein [Planctomycetaceae bacterium]
MKRFWLYSFALSIGMAHAQTAWSQYNPYNTSPSSYQVQAPYVHPQQYHLTGAQDQAVYSNPAAQAAAGNAGSVLQQPLPTSPQYAPQTIVPPPIAHPGAVPQSAPVTHYQAQGATSGCSSCATGDSGYGYAPQYQGATPYAFSATSVDCGANCYGGHQGYFQQGRHFGGQRLALPPQAKPWFAGGGVLLFNRIDDYNRLLSVDDAGMPVLYSGDAQPGIIPGLELIGGRYFNCGKNAIQVGYWGLYPEDQMVSVDDAGGGLRSSIFQVGEYQLPGAGGPWDVYSDTYDDNTASHRLRRSSEFHNVEINLLGFAVGCASRTFNQATAGTLFSGTRGHGGTMFGGCGPNGGCGQDCGGWSDCGSCGTCCPPSRYATGPCCYSAPPCGSRLNLSWLAGVRYFQFRDNFEYAAVGAAIPAGQTLSYDVSTTNHLVGFQVGGRTDYCLGSRANLYSMARAGIFGNEASLDTRLGTAGALAYDFGVPGANYDVSRRSSRVAFMSELGAGMGVRLSPKWTATAGYRAIVASGVATAVGNVRYRGQDRDLITINSKDYIVLHGVNIGALYNF